MATVIDEKAIQQILQETKLSDCKQRRRRKMRNWRVSHVAFRTVGYAGLLTGLFGYGLVWSWWSFVRWPSPFDNIPSDIKIIMKTTKPISTKAPTPSISSQVYKKKDTRMLRTRSQSLRFKDWVQKRQRRYYLVQQPNILLSKTSLVLTFSSIVTGGVWFLSPLFQRLPKLVNRLTREIMLGKTRRRI
jgi:hypothetical protein